MAARLNALILCDFAQVREGLLFVQSGGVTRLVSTAFPAVFGCHVACMVTIPPDEVALAHEMVMKIKHVETATVVATITVALHEMPVSPGLRPGEARLVPVVVSLAGVSFVLSGEHDLHVDLDDQLAGDLTFSVEQHHP